MLVTHDCALDKRDKRTGLPMAQRLSFVKVRLVEDLPQDQLRSIKRNVLQPYEAQYLGDIPDVGEAFVLVSDVYYLPAGIFDLEMRDCPETGDLDDSMRAVASINDSRVARLGEASLDLYRQKWIAFWTRQVASPT